MNPLLLPVADLGDALSTMLPIGLFLSIPIIAILTSHQQKMAKILHERKEGSSLEPQILAELTALRQQVAKQSAVIEELSRKQTDLVLQLDGERDLRNRLNA